MGARPPNCQHERPWGSPPRGFFFARIGSFMPTKKEISKHENVWFHFLGNEEDSLLPGKVIVRTGSMVLEVREGATPYLVVGSLHKHWFEGKNTAAGNQVDAKWAEVDGTYVGVWVEETYEYLFSFELGPATP